MTTLCFILTMPGRGSWDGNWSGDGRFYAAIRRVKDSKAGELANGHFTHCWSGGWRASVEVRIVSGSEITKIRRRSNGFCGYDWMVDTIISHGRILDSAALAELNRQKETVPA